MEQFVHGEVRRKTEELGARMRPCVELEAFKDCDCHGVLDVLLCVDKDFEQDE